MSRFKIVAELVELAGAVGLDTGGFMACVVTAQVGFAERAEEFAQGFVAEEVHTFIGNFKPRFAVSIALFALALFGKFGVDEVLFLHFLDDLVDEFFNLFAGEFVELFLGLFVEEFAGFKSLLDGFAEVLHGLVAVELLEAGHGVLEAGVEEEVGQGLHEVFEAEGGGEVAGEFCVADALHSLNLLDPAGVDDVEFGAPGFSCELFDGEAGRVRLLFIAA